MPPGARELLIFMAAAVAGAVNSVAGGGTLVTFPTLVWLGVPPVAASVTSTVALWPGSVGSVWGYRRPLAEADRRAFALVVPSVAGGAAGGALLLLTPPDVFGRVVPFLILLATGLFMAQDRIRPRVDPRAPASAGHAWRPWAVPAQLAVALYGGYFGAGMGILMLASLGLMGQTHIHRMNALKNLLTVCITGSAALYFALTADVPWRDALVMAAGAVAGGVGGAGVALRLGQTTVRRIVAAIGLAAALAMLASR
jgi:hypothetical protein